MYIVYNQFWLLQMSNNVYCNIYNKVMLKNHYWDTHENRIVLSQLYSMTWCQRFAMNIDWFIYGHHPGEKDSINSVGEPANQTARQGQQRY